MSAIDTITPTRAPLLGAVIILTNPTTLALYVSGLKEIVAYKLEAAESLVLLLPFIALVEIEFLVPIALFAAAPRRAGPALATAQRWLETRNRGVMIAVFGFFGVFLTAKGVSGLLG